MTEIETEIIDAPFGGIDPQQLLRTKPHRAGVDLFTDRPTEVWVTLGLRDADSEGDFRSAGPHISIAGSAGNPDETLDYDEEDAIKLLGAIAFAIGDLRKIKEAQR